MTMEQKTVSMIPENPVYSRKANAQKGKLRVVIYLRVGKEPEERQPANQAQVDPYTSQIMNKLNFKFSGIYTGKGISGINIKYGEGFNKMIENCMTRKIDMALTKPISGFHQEHHNANHRTDQVRIHGRRHNKRHL